MDCALAKEAAGSETVIRTDSLRGRARSWMYHATSELVRAGFHEPARLSVLAFAVQVLLRLPEEQLARLPVLKSGCAAQILGLALLHLGGKYHSQDYVGRPTSDLLGAGQHVRECALVLEPTLVNMYYGNV